MSIVASAHRSAGDALGSEMETEPKPLMTLDELKTLQKASRVRRKEELDTQLAQKTTWPRRIAAQGPWDPARDPGFSLDGPPSLPMPVKITETAEFDPFFDHIRADGSHEEVQGRLGTKSNEQTYDTETLEFPRGVVYADGRMDLCKQVLGPSSLPPLLDALHTNTHIVHFLFGNNIIGPTAATQIASYITSHDQMQTWYLAGNCINSTAFHALVKSWTASTAVTNIWLKRNPLGPEAADDVFRLITRTPNLRTLDLDQTSLSDAGVARLFGKLTEYCTTNPIPLRHLYLNGVGAGVSAATNIAAFLSSPNCGLESLCLSKNPLGSAGTNALAAGIAANTSLTRLSLQSVGMSDDGAITLLHAAHKPDGSGLRMLDLSQSFATEDLGSRYNWLTDSIVLALRMLVEESAALRYLDLGLTQCSVAGLNEVSSTLLASRDSRLLYLNAKAALVDPRRRLGYEDVKAGQAAVRLGRAVSERLAENVGSVYGGMGYQEWVDTERRFVVSPRDVRFIDSVYRNRDAGLARRGLKVLDKWWDEGDGTLEAVMEAI